MASTRYVCRKIAHHSYWYTSVMRCTTSTETANTSAKYHWRRQVGSLWRSIGMSNKDIEQMVQRGENKPLFRKYNILSIRISEIRELFPNADIVRMIKLMPSLLSEQVHKELVNKRYVLDRSLLDFDIDKLITDHPFILSKDSDFIGRNKDNLKELLGVNDTEFKIMIDAKPQIIMFDARRTISVKYQLIAQYFQKRIQNEIDIIYKEYNNESDDDYTDNEGDSNVCDDLETYTNPKTRKTLKYMQSKINKDEKNKLKWTVIRNPEILCTDWSKFCRLEYVANDSTFINHKFAVNRLLELVPARMVRKFPEYSNYLMGRLETDGGCDRQKLEPLNIDDLEEAMGELICLEHYPRSSEVDEHLLEPDDDEEDESDEEEQEEESK